MTLQNLKKLMEMYLDEMVRIFWIMAKSFRSILQSNHANPTRAEQSLAQAKQS